jgi:hypothetical protein
LVCWDPCFDNNTWKQVITWFSLWNTDNGRGFQIDSSKESIEIFKVLSAGRRRDSTNSKQVAAFNKDLFQRMKPFILGFWAGQAQVNPKIFLMK